MKIIILVSFVFLVTISQAFFFPSTKIYWNIASNTCLNRGIRIPLEDFGIIFNNEQHFHGEKIVTLYEKNVGLYPYLVKVNNSYNQFINGGLPQNVDFNEHLKRLKETVNLIIPNKKFNGLAIIDIEKWRPLFEANWLSKNIYRKESISNVIQKFPNISQNKSFKLGEKEFDEGALNFMVKTIKICKLLRPFAKWGFYGFPICDMNGDKRKGLYCYHDINDKLVQFLKYADALYPTAYIYGGHSYKNQKKYIQKVIKETKRLNELLQKLGYSKKEIYIFHKIEIYDSVFQNKENNFYDPYQLCISQGQSIANECEGIIIWSTSNDISKRCDLMKRYVELQFGPHIQKLSGIYHACKNRTSTNKAYCKLEISKNEPNCSEFLIPKNIKQWCNKEFFGERCNLLENTSTLVI